MKYIIVIIFLLKFCSAGAQKDVWTAYWNADTTLYGFKDKAGQVVITPRFTGMGVAGKLEHIMAVAEETPGTTGKWSSYFLTRSGKKMGFDSLYFFDNTPDCECEGFIRFKDHQLDKIGMLNRNGEVVIPAIYNYLDRVHNGLVIGLKGAGKKQDGEHYYWEGGETVLLDTTGNLLIPSFDPPSGINLYSLNISNQPVHHPDRVIYKAKDGRYYSFINYEREFSGWIKNIMHSLNPDLLKQHVFHEISYYTEDEGWVFRNGKEFVAKNYQLLHRSLQLLKQPSCDSFITRNGLNPFIYESKQYEKYFDNCNQSMEWKYPQMSICINTYKNKEIDQQQVFDFLRTDNGYQLIRVSMKGIHFK